MKWKSDISAVLLSTVILSCMILGCLKTDPLQLDQGPTPYELFVPRKFPTFKEMEDNPLTYEGIALGKKLYYDKKMSPNQSISCASCHIQANSFTSNAADVQVLPHINLIWYEDFLWHGSVTDGIINAMLFEVEDFMKTDVELLQQDPAYPPLFKKAFGSSVITTELCAKAIAQFTSTMVSFNSKFDRVEYGLDEYSEDELAGLKLFFSEKGDCFHCHPAPLFTDLSFHNNGLDSVFEGFNQGRMLFTNKSWDLGVFKTPSLRNIELTGPYMHDGRFKTLIDVVDHYDNGIHYGENTDVIFFKNSEKGLQLNQTEKFQLVTFLKTLTDTSFTTDPKFIP